ERSRQLERVAAGFRLLPRAQSQIERLRVPARFGRELCQPGEAARQLPRVPMRLEISTGGFVQLGRSRDLAGGSENFCQRRLQQRLGEGTAPHPRTVERLLEQLARTLVLASGGASESDRMIDSGQP